MAIETIETRDINDRSKYREFYEAWYRQQGVDILNGARVPAALEQLVEEIRPEHPDVRLDLKPTIGVPYGVVSVHMGWNFPGAPETQVPESLHDAIWVMARIATGEVVITTNQGDIVLPQGQWRIPGTVELALHQAYRHPIKAGLPSNRF